MPPGARRLDVAAARAAFAAGTLSAVRDDSANRNAERHAVVPELNRPDVYDVEHDRQSRLSRWQEVR